jgi:hypothetical protein
MKNQESRNNRAIVAEINQPGTPESGARSNAGKDSKNELDSRRIGKLPKAETVKTAKEDVGAAKRAREKQIEGNRVPVFKRGNYEETL